MRGLVSIILKIFLSASLFALTSSVTHAAADIVISPESGSFEIGKTLTVRVQVKTDQTINSADGTIEFDTDTLSLKSVSTDGSAFTLWVDDPGKTSAASANSSGKITFSGGATPPFVTAGTKTLFTISFSPKAEGAATVKTAKGKVLSGPGNDVTGTLGSATYSIKKGSVTAPVVETPPPPPTTNTNTNTPTFDEPEVSSKTHPEEGSWYNIAQGQFEWEIGYGVNGVRITVDQEPETKPTETFEPPIYEYETEELSDGEWYIHVAFKNRGGWGSPTHRMIKIDTLPPPEFSVSNLERDPKNLTPTFGFEFSTTTDTGSGLDRIDIEVDNNEPISLDLEDLFASGEYTLPTQQPGLHTAIVRLYDNAGNFVEKEVSYFTEVTTQNTVEVVQEEKGLDIAYWVSLLALLLAAVAFGLLIMERRRARQEKEYIKREADEVREKLEGIFVVLRDEVEEQVVALATKPNMTEAERQILEKLKEALEISEELLDKEVEDVRKLLL